MTLMKVVVFIVFSLQVTENRLSNLCSPLNIYLIDEERTSLITTLFALPRFDLGLFGSEYICFTEARDTTGTLFAESAINVSQRCSSVGGKTDFENP